MNVVAPSQAAFMKLGLPKLWVPKHFQTRYTAVMAPPPDAYGRIQDAQRLEGFNDEIGDCVPVGIINGVIDFIYRHVGPLASLVPNQLAKDVYSAVTGYKDGDPATDNGTDPDQMFAWWAQNDILGWKLKNVTLIDPRNDDAVKRSVSSVGFNGLVSALAIEQQNEVIWMGNGTPGTWGYHYTNCDGYDGPYTATSWGLEKLVDQSFFDGGFVKQVYQYDLVAA